jgi:hypothetical protein
MEVYNILAVGQCTWITTCSLFLFPLFWIEICGLAGACAYLKSLAVRVLLEAFGRCSTVHELSSFFVNIKEGLMIAPVVYVIAGSCGVALLRRSGDIPKRTGEQS